jgi:hypothetical protein
MQKKYRSIKIFVSHPFVPKNTTYNLKEFRENIKKLIVKAGNVVKKEHLDFNIDIVFDFKDFIETLPQQIETNIRNSHLAIVDITENNANVFYEYGLLYGLNIPVLLIKGEKSLKKFPLPSDIKNQLIIIYRNFNALLKDCVGNLSDEFRKLLHFDSLANIYLNKIWFPNDVGNIDIVTSTEAEKREKFSLPTADNYMLLESLGDKDSLLAVNGFLNRHYRNTSIAMYPADNYKHTMEGNFVVIGGPGDEDEKDDGNRICKIFMDKMNVKVSYSDDCERLLFNKKRFTATKKKNKTVRDFGYFARFPNPFNPNCSVILINGIHTFGVLGAARAFSDHPSAQGNIRKVLMKLKLDNIKQASFECFFPVDIFEQSVVCPEIDENYILPLSKK